MRRKGQDGAVLVEVLVAMAVTALVLLGLSSVVFVGSNAYQAWAGPIKAAQAGPPLGILAATIQGDAHRLVPCHPSATPSPTLDLCHPNPISGGSCQVVVRYESTGSGATGVQLLRETWSLAPCAQTSQVTVLRDLTGTPTFAVSSCSGVSTSSALITVSALTYQFLHHPGMPVLVVKGDRPGIQRILICTAGGEPGRHARTGRMVSGSFGSGS